MFLLFPDDDDSKSQDKIDEGEKLKHTTFNCNLNLHKHRNPAKARLVHWNIFCEKNDRRLRALHFHTETRFQFLLLLTWTFWHWSFMREFLINLLVEFPAAAANRSFIHPEHLILCPPPSSRTCWRAADRCGGGGGGGGGSGIRRFKWVDPDQVFSSWTVCLFLFGFRFNSD